MSDKCEVYDFDALYPKMKPIGLAASIFLFVVVSVLMVLSEFYILGVMFFFVSMWYLSLHIVNYKKPRRISFCGTHLRAQWYVYTKKLDITVPYNKLQIVSFLQMVVSLAPQIPTLHPY